MSQPAYPGAQSLTRLLAMLRHSTSTQFHEFWNSQVSILDGKRFNHAHMHSHRQITDLYLLGLAIAKGGRLVSFDHRIPLSAVHGAAPEHLVTL